MKELLEPRFVEVSGKVFRVGGKAGAARYRRRYANVTPSTCDENTDNHEHFWYFDGKARHGIRQNWALAEVVRLAWLEVLTRRFPSKRFRLFVSNEFWVDPDDDGEDMGVDTVLRLWSHDPKTAKGFDDTYHPDDVTPEKVFWHEFSEAGLLPVERVLAVIARGRTHPKYREAVKRRRKLR